MEENRERREEREITRRERQRKQERLRREQELRIKIAALSVLALFVFLLMNIRNKQRPFRLLKYLYENTDEDHALSTPELVKIFQAEDAHANRKTIKDDIDVYIPSLKKKVHRRVGFQFDDFIHVDKSENVDRCTVEFD